MSLSGGVDALATRIAQEVTTLRNELTNATSSGVQVWWFDAGGNASAARPVGAAATDVVIWTNTPSVPTNLGARDQWEDVT